MPDSLTQLAHLKDLNLSGNQLTQLPDDIGALTALTMLSLHGNQLQQIPQYGWERLQALKEVTLQGNCLTHIPDAFAHLGVGGLQHSLSNGSSCMLARLVLDPLTPAGCMSLTKFAVVHSCRQQAA